jgi:chromosome segregation ATPase
LAELESSSATNQQKDEILTNSRNKIQDNDESMKHILMLERSNASLQKDVERITSEVEELTHSKEAAIKRLTDDLAAVQSEFKLVLTSNLQLRGELSTVTARNNGLLDAAKKSSSANEREIEDYQRRIDELEIELNQYKSSTREAIDQVNTLKQEKALLAEKCSSLDKQAEEFDMLRQDYDQQLIVLNEAQSELIEARDTIHHLSAQLEVYLPKPDQPIDSGNRTLFSEVEDKRAALEMEHQVLSQKHSGLIGVHKVVIHQQERMKNHINRLTQLTQNRANDLQVKRLEELAGQLQSENTMLKTKIASLERRIQSIGIGVEIAPNATNGKSKLLEQKDSEEIIQCLHLRTEQLQNELESIRRQLNTANLIRTSESEKLRKREMLLAERESEMDGLRATNAKLKFDYDELQLKVKSGIRAELVDTDSSIDSPLSSSSAVYATKVECDQDENLPPPTEQLVDPNTQLLPEVVQSPVANKRLKQDPEESPLRLAGDGLSSRSVSPSQLELPAFKTTITAARQQSSRPKQVHISRTSQQNECAQQ